MDSQQFPTLENNGWELESNKKAPIAKEQINIGSLVKIIVIAIAADEEDDPVRSVTLHPIWVHLEKQENDRYFGKLKTSFQHRMTIKDGTEFKIGGEISFKLENIFSVRSK